LEDFALANTRSAIKRMRQNPKRRARNRVYTGAARTFVKKARTALEGNSVEEARQATLEAVSTLDKAAEKGILHKNNAARRKGRLMRQLAQLEKKS
jgi:small subunit ribosomal protein S20